MPFAPGQKLLHFRLVDKVGEGGMGEVWRAVDTTLDREVAIKVLPAAFARDPARIARMEREAKLLASLSHVNIAAIHGFPEAPAPDGSGETTRFLAMEMVHGEDLAETLARGPLPVRDAIDAARQIAAALEAAHDSGVVHRDLKPANVKRTPDGTIKVLDFGLAKEVAGDSRDAARSATVTSAGSVAGMVIGTVSYMSPEQARGQAVDRRTDLWAFGCVLYEMLTGARAFEGPTVTDVLARIVTGDPDWEKLPAGTPLPVRRLLRRCLEKDPRKRLRDAGDASLLLDENPEDARERTEIPRESTPRKRRLLALGVATLVIAIAAALAGYGIAHRGPAGASSSGAVFHRLTFARGMVRAARFAPDGRTIVYGAQWDGPPVKLYLARTDTPDSTPMQIPPAELLSVSRDGELAVSLGHGYLGWLGDGTLARSSLLGGAPREIEEHVRVADFAPDGRSFAIVRRVDGLDRLEYPAGTVLYETPGYLGDVRVSPDGERIAVTDHPTYADDRGDVAVIDRSGRRSVLLGGLASTRGLAWAPDGREVWFTASPDGSRSTLHAADLAGHVRVVYPSVSEIELFDIAADGRVLLGAHRSERQALALLAGFREPRNLVVPGESSMVREPSADGTAVLVSNQLVSEYETFLVRADRPGAVRLSPGDGMAISPDGSLAIAVSADNKTMYLSPLGAGTTRAVPVPDGIVIEGIPAFLPDGRRIVAVARRGSEPSRGYVIDPASRSAKSFGPPGTYWYAFGSPPVSPDGRYVVLQAPTGGFSRFPIEGGDPLPVPGLAPDDVPLAWSEDGRALYVGKDRSPVPIVRLDLATGKSTPWLTISPADAAGLRIVHASITPNGKYWALSTAKLLTDVHVVEGLK